MLYEQSLVDIIHNYRQKHSEYSKAGSTSVFKWNGKKEPNIMGPLVKASRHFFLILYLVSVSIHRKKSRASTDSRNAFICGR